MTLAERQAAFFMAVASEAPPVGLVGSFALSVEAGVAVYRRSYWARLHNVLGELFPHTREVVGASAFRGLATRFLQTPSPSGPGIEYLGGAFATWLEVEQHPASPVACFEWTRWQVAVAPDGQQVSRHAVSPGFEASTVVLGRWVATMTASPHLRALLEAPALERLVLWRDGFDVRWTAVGANEAVAIGLARGGAPVATLCEVLGGDALAAFATLVRWFERGWVTRIDEGGTQ
jgi:hypothetical protein